MPTDGLVIDGRRYPVPGVRIISWLDDPRIPRAHHGKPRDASKVTGSIAHTSRGKRYRVTRETGTATKGLRVARYLGKNNDSDVSAHVVIAGDGTVFQLADLALWRCNHAGTANGFTFGVEVAQDDDDPSLTRAQVRSFVAVMVAAHDALGIPKQIPMERGEHVVGDVRAWLSEKSGGQQLAFAGCAGHRCTSASRGEGDPGTPLMEALRVAGFVGVSPAAMTLGQGRPADVSPEDEADETHDVEDEPETPLPSWVDAAREIDAKHDLTDDVATLVRSQWAVLRGQGLAPAQAAELLAHAATETGRGRRAHGHNWGGVKLKERDDAEYRAKHGRGLAWWRDLGHIESGDDEVELYRAWDTDEDFWAFFAKRYAPRLGEAGLRYAAAGMAFWSAAPEMWFVELVRAGYRGPVRQREIAALADPETHPSVVSHRRLVARVRGLLT